MHVFEKSVLETVGVAPMFYTAVEKTGVGVDMAKFNNYVAIIQRTAVTQYGGALTAVIAESTDNTTYSDTYLATVTIASSTTTDQIDTVEVKASDLSAGYRYLRCEVTPGAGTQNYFSCTNLRFNPRFAAVQ
jgi:hypothetical protein